MLEWQKTLVGSNKIVSILGLGLLGYKASKKCAKTHNCFLTILSSIITSVYLRRSDKNLPKLAFPSNQPTPLRT